MLRMTRTLNISPPPSPPNKINPGKVTPECGFMHFRQPELTLKPNLLMRKLGQSEFLASLSKLGLGFAVHVGNEKMFDCKEHVSNKAVLYQQRDTNSERAKRRHTKPAHQATHNNCNNSVILGCSHTDCSLPSFILPSRRNGFASVTSSCKSSSRYLAKAPASDKIQKNKVVMDHKRTELGPEEN